MSVKKVVVFGGNGFVGSAILRKLVERGVPSVVSVSRRGAVPAAFKDAKWASSVQWTAADAFEPATYESALSGASAVVVSVGSPPLPFVDYATQFAANGESNAAVVLAAARLGVPRAVLINATLPQWAPAGYREGKLVAEQAAVDFVQGEPALRSADVLKPSAIYGTRYAGTVPIPLAPILAPVSWLLRGPLRPLADWATRAAPAVFDGLLAPPVPVEAVAELAVRCAVATEHTAFSIKSPTDILDAI